MKQREYEQVCEHMSVVCAMLSCKFQAQEYKRISEKFQRLAFKFNKLKEIKINKKIKNGEVEK